MPKTSLVFAGIVFIALLVCGFYFCEAAETGHDNNTGEIARIVSIGKNSNMSMQHLARLTKDIGSRPVGSANFLKACKWAHDEFMKFGLENVRLEQCGEIEGEYPDDGTSAFFKRYTYPAFDGRADSEMVPIFNVIADIPGTELPDEYVIVGAHLDSAPQGAGATDNGAGVAAVMEAARMLAVSGTKPRRTIRFILFGGEEAGLVGSKGYVEAHSETLSKISAVYNMDHGANYISGIVATKPMVEDMRKIFAAAVRLNPDMPFEVKEEEYLPMSDPNCCASMTQKLSDGPGLRRVMAADDGISGGCGTQAGASEEMGTVVKKVTADGDTVIMKIMIPGAPGAGKDIDLKNLDLEALGFSPEHIKVAGDSVMKVVALGSSDHAPFLAAGIPAFWWHQDENDVVPYPAHSKEDTYDKVDARYLDHSATVIALGALGTANLDHLLSREKLTAPKSVDDNYGGDVEVDADTGGR